MGIEKPRVNSNMKYCAAAPQMLYLSVYMSFPLFFSEN